ncbi:aspartic protease Yps1 [Schizosaccharomyces cryophilus OY26]|uniref:Aspartic protease Yps1 n=1 Tax=Schizosaccharomyces cryophilus (strain OY26 / ATCC MYA-4695 / CBS 11777 / NBRC 106824 / NRRL Y48691) TaxID=653667 RepID=S9WYD9_SCHCR|nr:aspartic protease Yps1 [Schizosaccharomyces cryophilus OY26]EPY49752.1 aspartic protease Yps1 [Schizosaccharomyces cryophilus OY26]
MYWIQCITVPLLFLWIKSVIAYHDVDEGIVALDVVPRSVEFSSANPHLQKRYSVFGSDMSTFPLTLQSYAYYTTTLYIGHPAIPYIVAVDLDMPYTWLTYYDVLSFNPTFLGIDVDGSQWGSEELRYFLCDANPSDSCYTGNSSLGFSFVNEPKTYLIKYDDNITVAGVNVQDSLVYNHYHELSNFQFGITLKEYVPSSLLPYKGVLGLAASSEINSIDFVDSISRFKPPTFLDQLVDSDILSTPSFSLTFDTTGNGTLILGGVDGTKYSGALVTHRQTRTRHYSTTLYSLQYVNSTFASNFSLVVDALLQTRELFIYLPYDISYALTDLMGGFVAYDYLAVSCDSIDDNSGINLQFGCNSTIFIKTSMLIVGTIDDICVLGIRPTSSSQAVLGLAFFRNAYTVFHQKAKTISIAQAYHNMSTNFTAILSESVPGASMCSQVPTSTKLSELVETTHFSPASKKVNSITYGELFRHNVSVEATGLPAYNISSMRATMIEHHSFSPNNKVSWMFLCVPTILSIILLFAT